QLFRLGVDELGELSAEHYCKSKEDFLDLQMILTGCTSLEQSLKMFYVMSELMDGDNQYECGGCNKLVDATRGAKLRSLPSILTFSLVRFAYDLQLFERYKETQRYTFPLELDMKEFCEQARDEDIYELYSVVIHKGSCYGGHYHAYIRDVDGIGVWTSPDEEEIAKLSANKGTGQAIGVDDIDHSDPVQLIRFLITNIGGKASISELCQSMGKETGISWNKTFKKRNGPLTKFIKKHTDVFDMVEGTVTLKHSDCNPTRDVDEQPCRRTSKNGNHNHATENNLSPEPSNEELCNKDDTGYNHNGSSNPWFDLNDSKVSCIDEQDIKKQFAGKESAYMLFYRRKGLQTVKINRDCLESSLPANLVAEVMSKNIELEKLREEFDLELNRISVMLHFCCDYTVKDGVIVYKEGVSTDPTVLTLDRRKTVTDFLHLVNERLFYEDVIHNLTVHTAVRLAAGIHLYEDVTACKSRSLVECGVNDGSELFIWCGKQVSISKISGIKPSKLILSIMKLSKRMCACSSHFFLHVNDDGSTLKVLDFIDGQRLIVDKKAKQKNTNCHPLCLAKSEAEKCDNQINIVVESHYTYHATHDSNATLDERPPWPVASVYVDKHKTLGELKTQIMSLSDFKISSDQSSVLRVDDVTHGLGPPCKFYYRLIYLPKHNIKQMFLSFFLYSVHEHQTVEEVLLDDSHTIIIEPGTPLTDNQIAIRFYCAVIGHSRVEDEIILDKSYTIRQVSLISEAERRGEERRGEERRGEERRGEERRGEERRGEERRGEERRGEERRGEERTGEEIIRKLLGVSHHPTSGKLVEEFESLDEVEVSLDDMLLDLKKKIISMLQAKQYPVASPECLRIQEIKDGFPARVLRHHNKTLRVLKVISSRKLSVQVLGTQENLSQSAILLNVRKRIPDKRCYGPPQQVVMIMMMTMVVVVVVMMMMMMMMVVVVVVVVVVMMTVVVVVVLIFNAPNGATSSSLHHCIGELFAIPVDRLSIAKYFRHKYEWLVISDPPSSQ
ncbi:hypothetical protein QZH41_011960, partial [Actinostola sp. cb2023]